MNSMNRATLSAAPTQYLDDTIFVGDLSTFADELMLREVFEGFGMIVDVRIKRSSDGSNKPLGYGFVRFQDPASATAALNEMNGKMLHGRVMRLRPATAHRTVEAEKSKYRKSRVQVLVSFICHANESTGPRLVTEQQLRALLEPFGFVTDCVMKKASHEPMTRKQSGYGFVHFAESEEGINSALNAVRVIKNFSMDGIVFDCRMSDSLNKLIRERSFSNPPPPPALATNAMYSSPVIPQPIADIGFPPGLSRSDDRHLIKQTSRTSSAPPISLREFQEHSIKADTGISDQQYQLPSSVGMHHDYHQSIYDRNMHQQLQESYSRNPPVYSSSGSQLLPVRANRLFEDENNLADEFAGMSIEYNRNRGSRSNLPQNDIHSFLEDPSTRYNLHSPQRIQGKTSTSYIDPFSGEETQRDETSIINLTSTIPAPLGSDLSLPTGKITEYSSGALTKHPADDSASTLPSEYYKEHAEEDYSNTLHQFEENFSSNIRINIPPINDTEEVTLASSSTYLQEQQAPDSSSEKKLH